jgi:hypothetical protein
MIVQIPKIVDSGGERHSPSHSFIAEFELRLLTVDETTLVRAAVWVDGSLWTFDCPTPVRRAFKGATLIALITAPQVIQAELWSDKFGQFRHISGFVGPAGYIVEANSPFSSSMAVATENRR